MGWWDRKPRGAGAEMLTVPIVLSVQLQLNYSSDVLLHSPKASQSRSSAGICQVRAEPRAALSEGGQEQRDPIVPLFNLFTREVAEHSGKSIPAAVLQSGKGSKGNKMGITAGGEQGKSI